MLLKIALSILLCPMTFVTILILFAIVTHVIEIGFMGY